MIAFIMQIIMVLPKKSGIRMMKPLQMLQSYISGDGLVPSIPIVKEPLEYIIFLPCMK